jgi:hypothetical protein
LAYKLEVQWSKAGDMTAHTEEALAFSFVVRILYSLIRSSGTIAAVLGLNDLDNSHFDSLRTCYSSADFEQEH